MEYIDAKGKTLSFNDYVKVRTDIGEHIGYINFFQNGKIRVNCLAGEFWVDPDRITLIARVS